MMHTGVVIAKLVTMTLGFLIAYQAYQRHNNRSILYFAIGFVIISFGAVIEGILYDVVELSFHNSGLVATLIVALGMHTILYAL